MQALQRCLSRRLGCSRDPSEECCHSEICARNQSFLLIGQDGKANNAIVHMGFGAEFTRMGNGECLPDHEQQYGEL